MLKLYGFKKVNSMARGFTRDLRVLWALEEMQMPFEIMGMDHPAKDLSTKSYHKLNPLEQIPVIDDDGNVLSESGAILIYLAKKAKKLIPSDAVGESQVLRWSFAAMNSLELPLMSLLMLDWTQDKQDSKYREFMTGFANRHLVNLDGYLEGREFIANKEFSVADILMAHVLIGVKDENILKQFKNVQEYRDRCLARPAWKKTMEKYLKYVEAG